MNRINKFRKIYFSTIFVMLLMTLGGCNVVDEVIGGNGSGSSNGTSAKIYFDLSDFTDTAGAVEIKLLIPDGIAIDADDDGDLATGSFTGDVSDGYYHSKYIANDGDDGEFILSMICAAGFEEGKIGELNVTISSTSSLSLIDQVGINSVMVSDLNGVEISANLTLSNSLVNDY